ncbi:hypothetical protein [Flaviaesturariibacter amylovorans]|uniref:hypothetical protein n=1 Tax=Flaviaesturariibacter amylovorans TaxID=1084520 RepID=UPI0031EBA875
MLDLLLPPDQILFFVPRVAATTGAFYLVAGMDGRERPDARRHDGTKARRQNTFFHRNFGKNLIDCRCISNGSVIGLCELA